MQPDRKKWIRVFEIKAIISLRVHLNLFCKAIDFQDHFNIFWNSGKKSLNGNVLLKICKKDSIPNSIFSIKKKDRLDRITSLNKNLYKYFRFYCYQTLSVHRTNGIWWFLLERQAVQSCNLKTVGYDNNLKNLEIEFHSGMVFQYQNVPSQIYANLISAQSTGTFFTDKIKNRYRSKRLDKLTL